MVAWDKLSPALIHSPALRLWGKLLVKCHREPKEGAPVSQFVQGVSGVQIKAVDLN